MSDWYNDDAFWETFQSYMFTPERIEFARVEVDGMTGLLGIQSGAKILDLCCGAGRHSLEFARRGFDVTGVDRTRAYLDKARSIAATERLSIAFVEADMREFVRPDTFDAAINFFTAFGYFDDPADDLKVARNLCTSLKSGGRLLLDVNGKETLAAKFRARDWSRRGDAIVLEERRLLDGWKRIESKWTWIRGDERRESTLTLRLYSGAELESILREAGFAKVELYGRLKGTPYDETADRLIAIATR
ncbi:MAG TPA: methyltransferase domain-containing protein [Candidatus Binatus sp.]|uniref:class I SAM-dependent methyltransferase n=1 Tax=Candidatus Binatus sp. TaxID=2811406 RepID=UPI002B46CDCA|nr:methyltransferase domain-containing protein [Candidatus Binatus sp.]HKN14463.1 methyltransferase domain-containing protein [Candidatus Binatus sp.]